MSYRDQINELIKNADMQSLLMKSAEFHGHICSFSAYGVKAGHHAVTKLGLDNEGMEEVLAIVEPNNCFSDGIQLVIGCTFGNNALIFKDLGKTAVSVINRKSKEFIRLALKKTFWESRRSIYPKAFELYEKAVIQREELNQQQKKRFRALAQEMALQELEIPVGEIFDIWEGQTEPPGFASIYKSVTCSKWGEMAMETRARVEEGKIVCISYADSPYFYLDGQGIKYRGEAC